MHQFEFYEFFCIFKVARKGEHWSIWVGPKIWQGPAPPGMLIMHMTRGMKCSGFGNMKFIVHVPLLYTRGGGWDLRWDMGTGSLKCHGFLSTEDDNSYPGVCCWGSIDGNCSWWHQEGQHHSKLLHFWYMKKSLLPAGSSLLVPPALEGNNSSRVPCLYTTILRKLPMSVNSNCAQHVLDLEMLQRVAQQD